MSSTAAPEPHGAPLAAAVRMARPGNMLLAMVAVALGAAAAIGPRLHIVAPMETLIAALAAALGVAGGNILNDIRDIHVDRVAHPERALPRGLVSRQTATILVLVAWLGSVVLAWSVSAALVFVASALIGLLVAYELAWKQTGLPGNIAIAVVSGALFPFGAVAVGGDLKAALVMGTVAGLAHLGRELQKDAEDHDGDAATRRTFAVRHGPQNAARLGGAVLVVAVLFAPLPHLVAGWPDAYLVAVSPASGLFLAAAYVGLDDPKRGRRLAKTAMVLALVAFLIGVHL